MTKCHVCGESALGVDGLVHFCPECGRDLCYPCEYWHEPAADGNCRQRPL